MPNDEFDELPNEIKLHIFSFLSIRDTVSALSVNKLNRDKFYDPEFWHYRAGQDFYPGIDDVNSKETYEQFKLTYQRRIQSERRIVAAYFSAYRHVAEADKPLDERLQNIKLVNHSFEHMSQQALLDRMKGNQYGDVIDPLVDQLFMRMVMGSRQQARVCVDLAIDDPHFPLIGDISDECMRSVSFVLCTLARCNADLSLLSFFRKIPTQQRTQIIEKMGALLLCAAAESGSFNAAKVLLAAGADPNKYGFYEIDAGVTHQLLPIVLLKELLFKVRRVSTRGQAIKTMILDFIAHGANMDLPGVKVLVAEQCINQNMPSLRSRAVDLLHYAKSHLNRYSEQELSGLGEILQLIISQPSCCLPAKPETDNRNGYERSMHKSPQPPHRSLPSSGP